MEVDPGLAGEVVQVVIWLDDQLKNTVFNEDSVENCICCKTTKESYSDGRSRLDSSGFCFFAAL